MTELKTITLELPATLARRLEEQQVSESSRRCSSLWLKHG